MTGRFGLVDALNSSHVDDVLSPGQPHVPRRESRRRATPQIAGNVGGLFDIRVR
jgi:hypothetical protein